MRAIKKSGFTLVEIMIVVMIIGLLSVLGLPVAMDSFTQAQAKTVQLDIQNFIKAIEMYRICEGGYPDINKWTTPQLQPYLPLFWPANDEFEEKWKWAQVSGRLPYRILYIDLTPFGEKMPDSFLRMLELVDDQFDDGSLATGRFTVEKEILKYYIINDGEDLDAGVGNEDDGIDLDNPGLAKK